MNRPLNRLTADVPAHLPYRILQFGGGNFLRAFVDWMVQVMNEEAGFAAGVLLVKPTAHGDYAALRQQEGLFHVLTRGWSNGAVVDEAQLVSAVQGILNPYQQWDDFLASAEQPALNIIVSNTTEAGLAFSESDVFSDGPPQEFPAKLTRWLYHRYEYFGGSAESGCVVLPCELLPDNGQLLRSLVERYAAHWRLPGGFVAWLQAHHHFCNTLVDRIVPGRPADAVTVQQRLGYEDELLVVAEPYHLWAIEGPPSLAEILPFQQCQTPLNIVLNEDLRPYRELKIRILNGAHSLMVPVGLLHGLSTVREMVEHERWGPFLRAAVEENILPSLDFPPETLQRYAATVFERFRNPYIEHRLQAIALNGLSKFQVRVLPSILAYYAKQGAPPEHLLYAMACLVKLYADGGLPLPDGEG